MNHMTMDIFRFFRPTIAQTYNQSEQGDCLFFLMWSGVALLSVIVSNQLDIGQTDVIGPIRT